MFRWTLYELNHPFLISYLSIEKKSRLFSHEKEKYQDVFLTTMQHRLNIMKVLA